MMMRKMIIMMIMMTLAYFAGSGWSEGAIGCAESHVQIFKHVVEMVCILRMH